mmetsp:Transcript_95479/g.297682  ORF Transcript_95479/g.297682 Transcript_95479/m.297682 type:complete len:265 (-) Transcript_95479:47-841(-)
MAGCTSTLSDTCKADTAVNAQCRSSSAPQHAASASKPAWMATPESMPPSCLRSSAGVPLCMDAPVQICINRESCHTAGSSCGGRSSWESSAPVLARPSAQAPSASTLGGRRVVAATLSASNAAQEWTLGKALLTTATNGCPGGFSAPRRMSTVWAHLGDEALLVEVLPKALKHCGDNLVTEETLLHGRSGTALQHHAHGGRDAGRCCKKAFQRPARLHDQGQCVEERQDGWQLQLHIMLGHQDAEQLYCPDALRVRQGAATVLP